MTFRDGAVILLVIIAGVAVLMGVEFFVKMVVDAASRG